MEITDIWHPDRSSVVSWSLPWEVLVTTSVRHDGGSTDRPGGSK